LRGSRRYADQIHRSGRGDVAARGICESSGRGGYGFPFKAADLNKGEFFTGLSSDDYHRARAYDIKVYKYESPTKQWQAFAAGADITKNESYYVWDKPIYAVADGVVAQVHDGMPANTARELPAAPAFNEGNHVYIRHGAEIVLYAHFKTGTIQASIQPGASVVKGQLLGRVGNSGRSWEPHLHISVSRAPATPPPEEPLRPLPFSDIYVLALPSVDTVVWPPNGDRPWNRVSAQCLPSELSAIWPGNLLLGRKRFSRFYVLTCAWMVILGALMITPGGSDCIACGPVASAVLGVVSVVLGILGLVLSASTPDGETVPEAVTLPQRLGKEHKLD